MSLRKEDVIERIYREGGFSKKEASELLEILLKTMKDTLVHGEQIKLHGFGRFDLSDKKKRFGRNPRTGQSMEISARRVLLFRPSNILKEDINNIYSHRISDAGVEDKSIPAKDVPLRATNLFLSNLPGVEDDFDYDAGDDGDDDF